jgi:hypothetical protein
MNLSDAFRKCRYVPESGRTERLASLGAPRLDASLPSRLHIDHILSTVDITVWSSRPEKVTNNDAI